MSAYNTNNLSYRAPLRDTVIIIHVTRWMEAVAVVCGFLMVTGLLELIGAMA
jgi:hypothetical protein